MEKGTVALRACSLHALGLASQYRIAFHIMKFCLETKSQNGGAMNETTARMFPSSNVVKTGLGALATPPDMLSEIMSPDVSSVEDERLWAPLGGGCYSRPLCLNVSDGY